MVDKLRPHQMKAIREMKNGCILAGLPGSGKSLTALLYFTCRVLDDRNPLVGDKEWIPTKTDKALYIITTALKRDRGDWADEMNAVNLPRKKVGDFGEIPVVVDSWNNINKYEDVKDAFFLFDEQRLVGSGPWVKAFLKIAANNEWVLLSGTPGDTWGDYIPVFVANGFYKNRSQMLSAHAVYSAYSRYPKIDRWIGTKRLERLRSEILVDMPFNRHTVRHSELVVCPYDKELYKKVMKTRWNIYKDQPIQQAGELFYTLRRVVNSDPSRSTALLKLLEQHSRIIVFYNYDYELEILRQTFSGLPISLREWNGHKHETVPTDETTWVYLVQYAAGSEGWNCTQTNATVFWSSNYSYKVMEQAHGRIDRLNTPYVDLYYYTLRSMAPVDLSIQRSLKGKKRFSERAFENKLAKTEA